MVKNLLIGGSRRGDNDVRRALVLTDEGARHPFLTRLAPHVRRGAARLRTFTAQDLREFLMAYCACFLAASAFIS